MSTIGSRSLRSAPLERGRPSLDKGLNACQHVLGVEDAVLDLRNKADSRALGGAIGTAVLATIVTKREQFYSNFIGQSVDLGRERVRSRIAGLTKSFLNHGLADTAAAHQQAIIALGKVVKQQALVQGFSDTLMVLGVVLVSGRSRYSGHKQVEGCDKWCCRPLTILNPER
ncbi:hypothetical protein [Bradyrhizobium sp. USDA 4011]